MQTVETLVANIEKSYIEIVQKESNPDVERLERERGRLELRLKNLMDMRLDGELDKDAYTKKKEEITCRVTEINKEIDSLTCRKELPQSISKDTVLENIRDTVGRLSDINGKFIDEDLVKNIVDRVIPSEDGTFKWFLNLKEEPFKDFSETDYIDYDEFDITFDEAKAYRKQFGNFIRMRQWNDIHVKVFLKV